MLGILSKRDDAIAGVECGNSEILGIKCLEEHHGHRITMATVESKQGVDDNVGEIICVNDDNCTKNTCNVVIGGHSTC